MRGCLALLALLVALGTPLAAQDANGTISTENSVQQDDAIATRIREILSELGNYADVAVSVNEGVVTLQGTTTSTTDATELTALANRVEGVVAVRNEVTETADIGERLDPAIERLQNRVGQLVTFLPLALIAMAVFFVILILGIMLARMRQPWDRLAPNAFIAELYRQFIRIAFGVVGLVVALDIINATALLSTILGAAGIIGLALGFAVRDTVENYIASVMLSIRQPFRPNDVVEINGDEGKVVRLTSRATILLSFDGNHIRIPNATVFKSRIVNFSENAERRFSFSLQIDRAADLNTARDLLEQTVQTLPFVLDKPVAQAWIEALEPSGATLVITGWIDQRQTSVALAKGEAIRQAKRALDLAGIALVDTVQAVRHVDPVTDASPQTNAPAAPTVETAAVAAVDDKTDDALEGLIHAERHDTSKQDLLHKGALKE